MKRKRKCYLKKLGEEIVKKADQLKEKDHVFILLSILYLNTKLDSLNKNLKRKLSRILVSSLSMIVYATRTYPVIHIYPKTNLLPDELQFENVFRNYLKEFPESRYFLKNLTDRCIKEEKITGSSLGKEISLFVRCVLDSFSKEKDGYGLTLSTTKNMKIVPYSLKSSSLSILTKKKSELEHWLIAYCASWSETGLERHDLFRVYTLQDKEESGKFLIIGLIF